MCNLHRSIINREQPKPKEAVCWGRCYSASGNLVQNTYLLSIDWTKVNQSWLARSSINFKHLAQYWQILSHRIELPHLNFPQFPLFSLNPQTAVRASLSFMFRAFNYSFRHAFQFGSVKTDFRERFSRVKQMDWITLVFSCSFKELEQNYVSVMSVHVRLGWRAGCQLFLGGDIKWFFIISHSWCW